MKDIYKILIELKEKRISSALCTIISTQGSTPLKTGAKMIVTESGKIYGTIGGGNLEKKVIENAISVINKKEPELFQHNLLQQHGMCCGGTVNVFIESVLPPDKLFIFGSGHVGRALAKYASTLSFDVYVIDEREDELKQIDEKTINKLPFGYKNILPTLPFDKQTFIAIMTYDHQIDREILGYCMKKDFAYLGMIGSQRKIEVTKKMFLSTQMFSADELAKVDMPMGININAKNPEEIAISILSKLIEVKNTMHQQKKLYKKELELK